MLGEHLMKSVVCLPSWLGVHVKAPIKSSQAALWKFESCLAQTQSVSCYFSSLQVEEALEAVKNATNEQDLANRFKEFGKEMVKLNYVAARRQQELKDPHCRDEMAAARGALKKNATMLYTASQAFLRHPDVAATRANRDYVFKQVQEAIAGISNAAQATSPTDENKGHTGIGELAAALNEFDCSILFDSAKNGKLIHSQLSRESSLESPDARQFQADASLFYPERTVLNSVTDIVLCDEKHNDKSDRGHDAELPADTLHCCIIHTTF
ncbi:hypothetical protein JD844_026189 [Phrynosoma platyrhinos]|uniref:Alpha N-catenin n=1 Tax=Phrynosoma platyrhinos TaxID=52577 RepID=A0ABQ7SEH9_PHRPL|nr:hypothetical protein JD844_026189 [Phrynosoma platyrhinos]